ncbi:MAG: 50S ribosomal protein L22 [Leptospiraceae bacterium]|nr:50S ribosomal protein L22 [Leptospiraceae bacterium]
MEAKAVAKYVRMSARKIRLVADEVRGYDYLEAKDLLRYINKRASLVISKLLDSAAANALVADQNIDETSLFIKKIYVDEAPILKRYRARARGRGARIRKRQSHITIVVSN